jgi:hypothetical protein
MYSVVYNIGAGPNESIVIIKRNKIFFGSAVEVNIFVDEQKVAKRRRKEEEFRF